MIHSFNKSLRVLSASAALALMFSSAPSAFAATPADTLVEGFAFDDIISMDPGEAYEISTGEITGNTYSLLVRLDLKDPTKVIGDLADSWTISPDKMTYTFKLKKGLKFASGNPITAQDVAFSFERAIKLDKSPAFIIGQFGLTGDNVADKAKATDDETFTFTVDKPYAPSFVLNCLSATVAAVVDKKLVMQHVQKVTPSSDYKYDNDFGNGWLKTNYAGSGPFKLREWKANQVVLLERNDDYYGDKPKMKRVIYRFMKESAAQRLALENGDIDIARNLSPNDLDAVTKSDKLAETDAPKGTVYYISFNQKNKDLAKPEVWEALKYLIDYDAIGKTLIKGIGQVHQTFEPAGMLGALDSNPYKLDIAKAKELLAKAGLPDGFSVTMDTRSIEPITGIAQSIQQTFAQGGVKLSIIPGDGKQVLTKYRARNHDIYIGDWGVDYWDPHSNAQTFTTNPDNSDAGKTKTLAWRNTWDPGALSKESDAALFETDSAKRGAMYEDMQKQILEKSPFAIIYQKTEVGAYSKKVTGFKLGPSFDTNYVSPIGKE
ncbi:MAG: ABC transporter substrate-binding protein [Neorhizobium sp.]|nr:ABC transporter substrate-binding protein [Neorhizobium sp.]